MGEQTHFGFEAVSADERTRRVKDVFRRISSSYDLMNDLMSVGIHRLWKDHLVQNVELNPHSHILDMAGGTGDIAFRFLKTYPHLELQITICDLTPTMIEIGRKRATDQGFLEQSHGVEWTCSNAENLPFADDSVDLYTIAYGLRNVTHLDQALKEAFRVLKVGGQFICLEFSQVKTAIFREAYDFYSFRVLPILGEYVAQDRAAYQYLVESIRQFPDQEALSSLIKAAGFSSVHWQNLCSGISCIHTSIK